MLPPLALLRSRLIAIVADKGRQGHDIEGLVPAIKALPDSYDAMDAMARRLAALPMRAEWPHVEPDGLDAIRAECPQWPSAPIASVDPVASAPRVVAAFLGAVCGCSLGKPLEISTDLARIRAAAEKVGEWPLRDYVSEGLLEAIGGRHPDWHDTVRGRIAYVAPDDDLNYTILGMLLLEQHGGETTPRDLAMAWLHNLPLGWQWGPERTVGLRCGLWSLDDAIMWNGSQPPNDWTQLWNPGDEFCGALIRADAYGYACPGDPGRAAALAWRDASFTHRRTGLYGTMFAAAAIAAAFVVRDPLEIFRQALRVVPARSRFHRVVEQSLAMVARLIEEPVMIHSNYQRVHETFSEYGHCWIYQEIGTVINTLRFATDVGDGIGKQVAQGNDTDSFGCTAGSILGAWFGPGHLEPRWLTPFNDTIMTTLATFQERSLSAVARRMGRLPARLAGGTATA